MPRFPTRACFPTGRASTKCRPRWRLNPSKRKPPETLLRKLVESTDPNHAAARYILAVMLERKRILRHRDTVTDEQGTELLVYEHAQTGESFTVPDPHLRLDQLTDVQQHVAELLGPAAPKAEAEPAADPAPVTATPCA